MVTDQQRREMHRSRTRWRVIFLIIALVDVAIGVATAELAMVAIGLLAIASVGLFDWLEIRDELDRRG